MYQITFFDCGAIVAVNTPSYRAAEALYFNLLRKVHPRLWNVSVKGKPVLLAGGH